jgi:LPXTG-site transpeptidase (sortase) family protein
LLSGFLKTNFKNILIKFSKILRTKNILIFLLIGLLFLWQHFIIQNIKTTQQNIVVKKETPLSNMQIVSKTRLPLLLNIPKLNINANIQYVSLTPDGLMDVPSNQFEVAWYQPGTPPGEIGSAVITGHFGKENSVFNDLDELKKGDEIKIINDQSNAVVFVVSKTEKYEADDNASTVFFSDDNQAHLNLITCQGVWNKNTKSYPSRLIIFTDLK